jgi:hypothetical protein
MLRVCRVIGGVQLPATGPDLFRKVYLGGCTG